jgi:hypothetical protein
MPRRLAGLYKARACYVLRSTAKRASRSSGGVNRPASRSA